MSNFTITIDYEHEADADRWIAQIRLREYRGGKQYGGAVLWEAKSRRKGAKYEPFMRAVRSLVAKEVLPLLS